ncbi:MAG: polysaccharide biosynthesis protein [Candidatus Omnitrophota bacterium]
MIKHKISWQEGMVFAADIFIIFASYIAAYLIRFEGILQPQALSMMIRTLPIVVLIRLLSLVYFKVHQAIRYYASVRDLFQIIKATVVSSVVIVAVILIFFGHGYPRSVFIIDTLLVIVGLGGVRVGIRLSRPLRYRYIDKDKRKRALIIGAGDAGEMILREILYRYRRNYEVVGLIDDDPKKYKRHIHGVAVLGTRSDIPDIVNSKRVQEIIIAIPSLQAEQLRGIIEFCVKSGAKYRTVPNLANLVDGTVKVTQLREVRLEDLLGRQEVVLNREQLGIYFKGKVVLVTGAGGSIGSEICRQAARLSPDKLILFEKSENALFYIDMELGRPFNALNKVPVIGDICDRARVKEVFSEHRPQIIFHAAAYKHVPLMELNCFEAVNNNIFGTKILAEEAVKFGVQAFVMLSTDKVVEPKSVMGVSKKIAELYIAQLAKKNNTKFMAVRFGNVLGSEGSVIPVFKKQIEKGGPVTVTHPDIKRYFMTIPEAAGLVIEAGSMGAGGEVFVLEMGRQIKIVDLARDLIRLSGLEPDKEVKIEFTGLRPGEKMFEALIEDNEEINNTGNEKIMVLQSNGKNKRNISEGINSLSEIIKRRDLRMLINKLREIVPNYLPDKTLTGLTRMVTVKRKDIDILILDDERIIQELLRKFLEGRGYNTFLARQGKEALKIVKQNCVRLAFIDIRIPGFMDGIKTLRSMKIINKEIEVILMTGFATEKTRILGHRLGAYAYMEKPLDLSEVKRCIDGVLVKRKGS